MLIRMSKKWIGDYRGEQNLDFSNRMYSHSFSSFYFLETKNLDQSKSCLQFTYSWLTINIYINFVASKPLNEFALLLNTLKAYVNLKQLMFIFEKLIFLFRCFSFVQAIDVHWLKIQGGWYERFFPKSIGRGSMMLENISSGFCLFNNKLFENLWGPVGYPPPPPIQTHWASLIQKALSIIKLFNVELTDSISKVEVIFSAKVKFETLKGFAKGFLKSFFRFRALSNELLFLKNF